jgi:hypothetical protein
VQAIKTWTALKQHKDAEENEHDAQSQAHDYSDKADWYARRLFFGTDLTRGGRFAT